MEKISFADTSIISIFQKLHPSYTIANNEENDVFFSDFIKEYMAISYGGIYTGLCHGKWSKYMRKKRLNT